MATRVIKNSDKEFSKTLEDVEKRFFHSGGDEQSETILNWNKQDFKEGYVGIWTNNKDASKLIKRSKQYILEIIDYGYAVDFKMDKKGFRSAISAFKVGK